jgi:hypothetical protein
MVGKFFVAHQVKGEKPPLPFALINKLYSITGSDIQDGSIRYWFFPLAAFPGYQETL